jgi:predicted ATPase/DNA-binding CsgD family transcriptional regulator
VALARWARISCLSQSLDERDGVRMTVTNVPIQLTSFVGRERELADIQRLLSTSRLVTLSGAGGCGKTRLAIQIARTVGDTFTDGVWLVDLAPLRDPALVPQLVAQTLGVHPPPSQPLIESLLSFVQPKQLLLILNNCEHLIAACAQFAHQLLSQASGLRLLATSRAALAITGETLYRVHGLAWPALAVEASRGWLSSRAPQDLLQYDAVRLFVERAAAIAPTFTITSYNAPAIVEICRRLDGIPLALELASARINVLTVRQIAARLDDRFALLTSASRTALVPHHQTLRATIDWSYALLTAEEQTLFRRLAVFAAGFALDTAEAVCSGEGIVAGRVLDLLASLVAKSLVVAETTSRAQARYRLLETIREYAQEKLKASHDWISAHDHYLACYVHLTEEIAPKLREQYQQLWLNQLEAEHDNIRAALAWAVEQGHIEEGVRIGTALFTFWQMRAYAHEGRVWFEHLLKQADDKVPLEVRVNALTWLSVLAAMAGDMQASTVRGEEALALCEAAGEAGKHVLKVALIGAATAARSAGDYETTYALGRQIIELYRELGDMMGVGTGTMVEGEMGIALGKYDEAHALLSESLALARAGKDAILIGLALKALGDLARCEGRFAQAGAYYDESLLRLREVGAAQQIAIAQHGLAHAVLHQGDLERARSLFGESLETMRRQDDRGGVLKCLLGFAALASATGLASDSARLYAAAVANSGEKPTILWPPEKIEYEHYLAQARANLSDAAFEAEQAKGRAVSIEPAIEYALNLPVPLSAPAPQGSTTSQLLTEREREVAVLIAQGKSNSEIAGELVLSKRTVEKHIANILSKLELTSRAQIVRWAIEQDLRQSFPS